MDEKTPKFDNINVSKKESKLTINLSLINVDQRVVSDKFKHSDNGFKYFIGYKEDEIIKPQCIYFAIKGDDYQMNTVKLGARLKKH